MAMTRTIGDLTLTDEGQHGFGERIDRNGEPIGFIHEGMVHGGYYARAIKPRDSKGKGVYCATTFHATEREAIAAAVAAHDAPEPDPADAESAAAEIAAAKTARAREEQTQDAEAAPEDGEID